MESSTSFPIYLQYWSCSNLVATTSVNLKILANNGLHWRKSETHQFLWPMKFTQHQGPCCLLSLVEQLFDGLFLLPFLFLLQLLALLLQSLFFLLCAFLLLAGLAFLALRFRFTILVLLALGRLGSTCVKFVTMCCQVGLTWPKSDFPCEDVRHLQLGGFKTRGTSTLQWLYKCAYPGIMHAGRHHKAWLSVDICLCTFQKCNMMSHLRLLAFLITGTFTWVFFTWLTAFASLSLTWLLFLWLCRLTVWISIHAAEQVFDYSVGLLRNCFAVPHQVQLHVLCSWRAPT